MRKYSELGGTPSKEETTSKTERVYGDNIKMDHFQISSGAYTSFYAVDTGGSFPEGRTAEA
jgi:hypothetical protein